MEIPEFSEAYFKEKITEVQVRLYPEDVIRSFKSLTGLYQFIEKEHQYWSELKSGRIPEIYSHFSQVLSFLKKASNSDHNDIIQQNLTTAINMLKNSNYPAIYSNTIYAKLLKEVNSKNPRFVNGIIEYLQKQVQNISNFDSFHGVMYAFLMNDRESAATREVSVEKDALDDLRKEYVNQLNILHSKYLEKTNGIAKEQEDLTNKTEEWRKEQTQILTSFHEQKKQQFDELEKLYREKLRISEPATYWEQLSERYKKSGGRWRNCSIVLSAIIMTFLTWVLFFLPDKYFLTDKGQFNVASLKVILFFAVVGSIGIYLIRLFVKLTTSSYHLSIDAYERYQLTHVFISLLKDKAITDQEKIVVLQSIFSRADTGLLKGDSGPTLPEGPVQQIMKNMGK